MAERLTPGAMPEDWTPPRDPPAEPYSYASRWFSNGMGGGRVDPHPADVSDPGMYAGPDVPRNADVRTVLQLQRAAAAGPSPHLFRMTNCTDCGTGITYYGRADRAPDEPRCPACTGGGR